MTKAVCFCLLGLLASWRSSILLAAEEFVLPQDLEVRVWASTPQLFNPTNIDIDARGRVWVAEGVNYRETIKPQNALKHPKGDRIMILEDTDGDGFADSSKVFVEDPDLVTPLGIAVLGDKIVVSCSPNMIVYTDSNHDDKPDKKEIFLTGWGGRDHDHGVHAVVGGPDGRWYFNCGNAGPHEVTDKSGWHLSTGSIYKDASGANTGGRRSSDGRVWTGGLAFSVDADGKHLTPLAHNFRNSYELALDSFGNIFQTDNDDDGHQACRFSWVMEGGNYGYFSPDGNRSWRVDRRPGQSDPIAHWRQDDPGVAPVGDILGAGGPTGVVVYEGDALPARYHGAIFSADGRQNCVYMHTLEPDGAGYKYKREMLIAVKNAREYDPKKEQQGRDNWFRPSDVAVGTDGAVYVADWFDPMVGGHDLKEKEGQGRILRISARGSPTRTRQFALATLEEHLDALDSPAVNVRYQAFAALKAQGETAFARLQRLMDEKDFPRRRARTIWLLAQMGDHGLAVAERALSDADENIRITALRAIRQAGRRVVEHLQGAAKDKSPEVRREAAIALRDVPREQAEPILLMLAEGFDGRDRFYLEALGIGCDGKEEALYPKLIERLEGRDPLQWSEALAAIVWRLHPVAAIDVLAMRAAAFSLSADQRRQAVVTLAFVKDARAAEVMARLAANGPDDVREQAQWWLRNRADSEWADFAAAKPFATTQPDEKEVKRQAEDRATMLDAGAELGKRVKAAQKLATDTQGGTFILALAAEGKFPKDLSDAVTEALSHNPDFGVRALAGQYFPRKAAGGQTLPPIGELVAMKGDAARGKAIFFGATAGCARCHTVNGEGRDVGPDLTSIKSKYARKELLDAILNPSAAILMGYEAWIVKTKKNQVYSGFILADGKKVVIKESSGEQVTIPADQVTLRKKQELSVMPDNVAVGLSAQELADLAEFLLTR